MEKDDDVVKFDGYPDTVSAYIVKGLLETNGIQSFVTTEFMSSLYPIGQVIGEVNLMVMRKDLERARQIVDEQDKQELIDNEEDIICFSNTYTISIVRR